METPPPFAPTSSSTNDQVAAAFVRGEPTESSPDLTVAGEVLLAGGRVAAALRAGPGAVFVRTDLPGELSDLRTTLERALAAEGLASLDADSTLAKPLARERLGIDSARWDLWGRDLAEVFAVLAARGGTSTTTPQALPLPVTTSSQGAASPTPTDDDMPSPGGKSTPRRSRALLVGAGVIAVVLLAAAVITTLSDRDSDSAPAAQASPSAEAQASPSAGASPAALVDYRDPAGQFTLQHPESWEAAETTSPELVLVGPDGGSMLVRLVKLEKPVDPANIADVKTVTDVIVKAPGVAIVQEQPVEINGATGYFYLYTFQDGEQEGVHAHYFLFQGTTMHTLVLQALPAASFDSLADQFDSIAQSYRIVG